MWGGGWRSFGGESRLVVWICVVAVSEPQAMPAGATVTGEGINIVYHAMNVQYTWRRSTVKPVYNGHCISRSPLYNSQVTESQMGLQCAFQPALTGHLSI